MKKYINKVVSIITVPIKRLKTLYDKFKQISFENESGEPENPKNLFLGWLLDVEEYGIIAAYIYSVFLVWKTSNFFALVFAFGLTPYLITETITKIRDLFQK